jgi:glucosamine--fructose-6-phosphate aminotransferase (isomerizing)
MYLGRDALFPVALEGALKLTEISYIHTEAYPAGEMKHGPVALIDKDLPIVYFHLKNDLYDKSRSNLEEVRARGGRLIIVGTEGDESLKEFSDDVIYIPDANQYTQSILANIPMQLFAYYMAVERGNDVDQPRNLAKSVTVE